MSRKSLLLPSVCWPDFFTAIRSGQAQGSPVLKSLLRFPANVTPLHLCPLSCVMEMRASDDEGGCNNNHRYQKNCSLSRVLTGGQACCSAFTHTSFHAFPPLMPFRRGDWDPEKSSTFPMTPRPSHACTCAASAAGDVVMDPGDGKDTRKVQQAEACGRWPPQGEKGKETHTPLEPPEGASPADALILDFRYAEHEPVLL